MQPAEQQQIIGNLADIMIITTAASSRQPLQKKKKEKNKLKIKAKIQQKRKISEKKSKKKKENEPNRTELNVH